VKRIYAIPGLGTTKELFRYLDLPGCDVIVLEWPETKELDLQNYAREFIKQIDTSVPFYLMGVSFGGMICSELSHLLDAKGIFLISSCKTKNEFPWLLKTLRVVPIHKLLPDRLLLAFASYSNWILGFDKSFNDEFLQMLRAMKPNYFRDSITMIVHWQKSDQPINVKHIHGTKDRLLLYGSVNADHTIKGGSHAMIVYHAKEISEWLLREMN
jgi:hypothetical protein